jgi:type II secretory pathway pseudopilin PulG
MNDRALVPHPRPVPPRRPGQRPVAGAAARRRAATAGFSTVELMVALVVLGLGILGVANLFPLGSRVQLKDRLKTSAADLAQQKMEQLRLLAWSDPLLIAGTHPSTAGEALTLENEGSFQRFWIVEDQTGSFADMKKVTVRVTWRWQRADTVDLVSYFRR